MKACVVMDFLIADEKKGEELMNAVSEIAKEGRLDILIVTTANKKSKDLLYKRSGFMQVPEFLLPQQLPFIARLHNEFEGSALLFNLDNWHFSFGDYDIF